MSALTDEDIKAIVQLSKDERIGERVRIKAEQKKLHFHEGYNMKLMWAGKFENYFIK